MAVTWNGGKKRILYPSKYNGKDLIDRTRWTAVPNWELYVLCSHTLESLDGCNGSPETYKIVFGVLRQLSRDLFLEVLRHYPLVHKKFFREEKIE